jgi:hypothetical protein
MERQWGTLADSTTTMMHHWNASPSSRGMVMRTVVYLHNRLPTLAVIGGTCGIPCTLLFGHKGCHPPRLGYKRQHSGDFHPSLSHHQSYITRGHRYRPTTRTYPPPYGQRMLVPPYPRLHELPIRIPTSHPPRHILLNHTPPQSTMQIRHPHPSRQNQRTQQLYRQRPRRRSR